VVRIYDKVAEYQAQFDKLRRKASLDADPLEFTQEFGLSPDAVLTRIERQFGGGRIPPELVSFGNLSNAPDFDPFSAIEITDGGGDRLPSVGDCASVTEYLCGLQVNEWAQRIGMQQFRAWLNRNSGRNGARFLDKYARFLPNAYGNGVTSKQLYDNYRESTIRQLAA
jgi:hypothetical protein